MSNSEDTFTLQVENLPGLNPKLFIALFFSFMIATVIGTLSHEYGHYIAASALGYKAEITYNAAYWDTADPTQPVDPVHAILITIAGPLQTSLTGSIGLLFLFRWRKRVVQAEILSPGSWVLIFMSLFWLRETANFCMWLAGYLIKGTFSSTSDEVRIAQYFHLAPWTIILTAAVIGMFVLAFIVLRIIPPKQRVTFIAAGLAGGITGYYLWLVVFGKYILP